MKGTTKWSLALLSVCIAAVLAGNALVRGKGKPPHDPPPPPAEPSIFFEYIPLTLPGQTQSTAANINELGEVVGYASMADGTSHGFFYTDRFTGDGSFAVEDLNNLLPPNSSWFLSYAIGLNNYGDIVGEGTFNGEQRGFRFSPPFFDELGDYVEAVVAPLPVVAGFDTLGDDINDSGDVSGLFRDENGLHEVFVMQADGTVLLTGAVDPDSRASRINASGSVVRYMSTPDGRRPIRFDILPNGNVDLVNLGLLGDDAECFNAGYGRDINDAGQTVGESTTGMVPIGKHGKNIIYGCGPTRAFVHTPSVGMFDLGTLGGSASFAQGINNAGDVVGTSDTESGGVSAFLFTDLDLDGDGNADGMIDIVPGIINLPAEASVEPFKINNSLEICGGWQTAFVLRPIP